MTENIDNLNDEQKALETLATENCLIRVVAGSHAYGTNIEGSDWDERSIFADDMKRIVLPFEKIEQVKFIEDDKVSYELSKFMPLLLAQNPNVIELLWTDKEDILYQNELGQILIDHRAEFLSLKVKDSYVGYALAQLKRIKGHNKWINSPQPEKEPGQSDFVSVVWNFSNNKNYNKEIPKTGYVAISLGNHTYSLWKAADLGVDENQSWFDKRGTPIVIDKNEFNTINVKNLSPEIIVKVNFDLFDNAHTNWKSYWSWKKNRNEKRGALEEKFGYDVKHAMHLIRLLKSGIDILENGVVPVKRYDAQHLLDIRFGKYSYEEIVKEANELSAKIEMISQKSKLPKEANLQLAKDIMFEIYSKQWNLDLKEIKRLKLK